MVYESRINENASESSDLDIFIVSENRKFIAIKILLFNWWNKNRNDIYWCFWRYLFKNRIKTEKLKNKYNNYEQLTNILNVQVKKKELSTV